MRLNYDQRVTYETVVPELFMRMPDLQPLYQERFDYLEGEVLPHVVFGSFLIPVLETALENRDTERIDAICAFLEEAATSANFDAGLEQLLLAELGEWLGGTPLEAEIKPTLGEQTKRVCRYVSGLATQRNSLKRARRNR